MERTRLVPFFFHVSPFFFVFFFHFFRSFFFPFFLSFFFHEFCLVRGCKRVERVDVDLTLAGFSSLNGRGGDANFQKREYLYIYTYGMIKKIIFLGIYIYFF